MITTRKPAFSFVLPWAMVAMCLLVHVVGLGQSGSSALIKQANRYLESGYAYAALPLYQQAEVESQKDRDVRLQYARCLYLTNNLRDAVRVLTALTKEKKVDPDVFYWLGKSFQGNNHFPEAIDAFKEYLRQPKKGSFAEQPIKDEIIRSANGRRLFHSEEKAFVENAGPEINSTVDEFGVHPSPTTLEKLYFHSNRNVDASGNFRPGDVDIYSVSIINGRWSVPQQLPASVNSHAFEQAYGFSTDGQILFYLSGKSGPFRIMTDTFSQQQQIRQGVFHDPGNVFREATDLFFFNDTICLYSANQPGGQGGYDLYISMRREGIWQPGVNAGPIINSAFDERFPFLCRDGRTLFFSSNNLFSGGGYDLFQATFFDELNTWSAPQNLGFPINSAGDDTHFSLASDGLSGYITSDRKGGLGGKDIYRVIFKSPIDAHHRISHVPTFYHQRLNRPEQGGVTELPVVLPEIKEYYISHLFLGENGDVLTPQNIKKLDLVAKMMQIYPNIKVELSGYEGAYGQRLYNLYFSIKKTEQAMDYLVRNKISRNRILVKGYGSSFPFVIQPQDIARNPLARHVNYRIEFRFHDFEEEPVEIHVERIQIPDNRVDPASRAFTDLRDGLYYSVQILTTGQMLQNPDLEIMENMFIDMDDMQSLYRYMMGFVPTFQQAERTKKILIEMGFLQAEVIAYVRGVRVQQENLDEWMESYPDLEHYKTALESRD